MIVLIAFDSFQFKYSLKDPNTFSVGSVGFEDCDCPSMDFTYVRVSDPQLDRWLLGEIDGFATPLCQQGIGRATGKVSIKR